MAGTEYFVLSNYDTHLFLAKYTDSATIPSSGTELTGVLPFTPPTVDKEVRKYRTLDGNGWESVAALGQAQGDMTLNFLRTGTGDTYDGTAGSTTYSTLKNWVMNSVAQGGQTSPKCIILVRPRGTAYEGVCYYVIPKSFADGEIGENGQEFSVTVTPFGPPVPVTVTVTKGSGTWSFAAVSGS